MRTGELSELTLSFLGITFSVSLLIYYIQWKRNRKHLYKLSAKIPLVDNGSMVPILGHALHFWGDTEKILSSIRLFTKVPSPPRIIWLGHRLFFTISRPEDLEIILNSPKTLNKDDLYRMTRTLVGDGLFSAPVPLWKKHRKIIMPTFNQRILDGFVEVFAVQAEILCDKLARANCQTVDLLDYATKFGLDTVFETAMGVKINAQTTESEYEEAMNRCLEVVMIRMFSVPYHFDFMWNLTKLHKEERRCVEVIHELIESVIKQKKEEYRLKKSQEANKDTGDAKKRLVFLDMLIELSENGENWTDYELRSEASTFMVAGSDTSATVGSFAALMLGMHQDIQQKCYEEIMAVVGPDRNIEYSDLPKMVYLEKIIKESLRLFPAGPLIVRKVDEDIEVGGYVLPKGAGLVLAIIAVHYSDLYYKDPYKFDPERFSPEELAKRHKYCFLPFSGGPRNCVGLKYGMMSLKTMTAALLRRFRIETDYKDISEIKIKQSLIIKAVDGFPLRFIPRK